MSNIENLFRARINQGDQNWQSDYILAETVDQ